MLKKFSIIVFLVLTIFLCLFSSGIHVQEDIYRLLYNSSSDFFYEADIYFPLDLKQYTTDEVVNTMIETADRYSVNILFEKYDTDNSAYGTSHVGRYGNLFQATGNSYELYAYIQQPFMFENLNIRKYQLNNFEEFNTKEGYYISNTDIDNKIGHITTTHPEDLVTLTTLKGYQGDLLGSFRISSTSSDAVMAFRNEIDDQFYDLFPLIDGNDTIKQMRIFSSPSSYLRSLLLEYYKELILLFMLLVLTSMLYIYNEKRATLIKKISGYKDIHIFLEYIFKLILPGVALSFPLFFLVSFIHFNGISPRIFSVMITYYLFLIIILLIYFICTLPIYLYIRKMKGVEVIKYREDNNIFLFSSLLIKAILVPILLLTLALSIIDLNYLSQQKKDIELRSEIYQDFVTFRFATPNSNTFAGDFEAGETYIHMFHQILDETLNIYTYNTGSSYSNKFSMLGHHMVSANANFINDSQLIDIDGDIIHIDASKGNYVLIPEQFEEDLRNNANYPGTDGKLENALSDVNHNPVEIIIIQDNQKIKAFGGNVGGYENGYSKNNIIFSDFHIIQFDDIYIDSSAHPNYEEEILSAFSNKDLELLYSFVTLTEIYQNQLQGMESRFYENMFITVLYIFFVSYISALSIYLYYKTKQKEVYVKTLHGSYVSTNFKDLIFLNFLINGLVFMYLYWIKVSDEVYLYMYAGEEVRQFLIYAFSFLIILDIVFICSAIWYVKHKTLAQAIKEGV